jgi:hypothetical protein
MQIEGAQEDGVWMGAIGLSIFVLALAGLKGVDLLGWVVTTSVWRTLAMLSGQRPGPMAGLVGLAP